MEDREARTTIELVLARLDGYGDRLAITVDEPGSRVKWTYRDLLTHVWREARRLEAAGVGRGDVVAIMVGNTPAGLLLRWAVNVTGAAFTALPDGYAAPAVADLLTTCRAGFLVTDGARRDLAGDAAARAGARVVDLDAAPAPETAGPLPVRIEPGDLASISLTGGSTGIPKGVPRYAAVPAHFSPAALEGWRDTVLLVCTPIAHLIGTTSLIVLMAGGRIVLQPGFDAGRALAAVSREGVDTLQLMPRHLHQILDHPDLPGTDVSGLVSVRIGSAPASPDRIGQAVERFGPIVAQGYGSIEATTISAISAEELARPELRGTVGRPAPGVEVSIRDDDGAEAGVGTTGEVWVRGAGVMPGYVNAPEQTAAVLRDGWLRTGDLGHLDADGYLTLSGRRTDVIFAAVRVHPVEVENALVAHPDVTAAGVFGESDAHHGEVIVAAVVPRAGRAPDPDALIAWVTERRGRNVAPSEIRLVAVLPSTPTGKIDRKALPGATR